MVRKLIVPLLLLLLLSGCGSAAPMETAGPGSSADSFGMGSVPPDEIPGRSETVPAVGNDMTQQTDEPGAEMPSEGECVTGNYFLFSRDNNIVLASDGTEILYEHQCDVTFTSADVEQDLWVDSILDGIGREYAANSENLLKYAAESLEINGKEGFYGYSNYQDIGIARHDQKIVSLLVLSSIYSGGSHPNSVQTAWNLDMEQGVLLKLEDILREDSEYVLIETVQRMVTEKFQAFGPGALFEDYQLTIENSLQYGSMTPYWYLNDAGLVIFFNQYTLGPYAAGIIKLEIPYDALKGILLDDYFPYRGDIPGDLMSLSDREGYRKILITVDPEGERALIGVEREVFQLQLSEVLWLEGNAIGQTMLFSADRMDQMSLIALVGGFDDETRSFALEFQDGTGNKQIYYVHSDGLSKEP